MSGWIKIYRQITEHWIWDDPNYLKAWMTILLTVNHEDKNVLIEKELIECKRGQSLLSVKNWGKLFGKKWNRQHVRTFFDLLKKDSMITTEGLRKTTRLTVCNYELYQMQTTNKEPTGNQQVTTNKNDKKDKKGEVPTLNFEERQKIFLNQLSEFKGKYSGDMLNSFYNYWSEKTRSGDKMRWEKQETWELSKRLTTWNLKDQKYKK